MYLCLPLLFWALNCFLSDGVLTLAGHICVWQRNCAVRSWGGVISRRAGCAAPHRCGRRDRLPPAQRVTDPRRDVLCHCLGHRLCRPAGMLHVSPSEPSFLFALHCLRFFQCGSINPLVTTKFNHSTHLLYLFMPCRTAPYRPE